MRLYTNNDKSGNVDFVDKLYKDLKAAILNELIQFRKTHPDADYRDMITITKNITFGVGADFIISKIYF